MGKQVRNDPDDLSEYGAQAVSQTDPNDPDDLSSYGAQPVKPVKKKGSGSPLSSNGGLDLSPAANYRQSLKDAAEKSQELAGHQEKIKAMRTRIDQSNILEGDPQKLAEFKTMTNEYNSMVKDNDKRVAELKRIEVLLDQGKESYRQDNFRRQQKLFKTLGLSKEETQKVKNQIFKQSFPEQAADVDSGKLLPDINDIDAEDLANALTGKGTDELKRLKVIEENRPISDRIFGTFGRSVEKTLAFELPASVGGTIQNILSDIKIKPGDLERSSFSPGIGNQLKKAINLIPGAKDLINSSVDSARVAAFEWADTLRNSPEADYGIMTLKNDQNLIRSISQINQPLDAIDFVFSNAGQGVAQILPSILTRGTTSMIQEIGNNQLDGTIEIAKEFSAKEGRKVTPMEVIKRDLDEPVTARNFGIIQGALDAVGAGKVAKTLGYDAIKKDLKKRTVRWFEEAGRAGKTEFITEGTQGLLGQLSTLKMKGLGNLESVKKIDWFQVLDEAIAGAVGGASVTSGGLAATEAVNRIGLLKELSVKKGKTPEQVTVLDDFLNTTVEVAKKYGDPRTPEEIKAFVQRDVMKEVPIPKEEEVPGEEVVNTPPQNIPENIPTAEAVIPEEDPAAPVEAEPVEEIPENVQQPEMEAQKPQPTVEQTPEEVIQEFQSLSDTKPGAQISAKEKVIGQHLGRFPKESFARFGDNNFIKGTPIMRMSWLGKKGIPIDVQAQDMSYIMNPEGDGTEITPDDIVQFVERFPRGKKQFNKMNAEDMVAISDQAVEALPSDYFNGRQDLKYALESINKIGITPENIQSPEIQEYLTNSFLFDDADRDNINTIFEYARTPEGSKEIDSLLGSINEEVGREIGEQYDVPKVQSESPTQKIGKGGFPVDWQQNQVAKAPDAGLQANPPPAKALSKPKASSRVYYQGIPQKSSFMQALLDENGDVVIQGSIDEVDEYKKSNGIDDSIVKFVDLDTSNPHSLINKFSKGDRSLEAPTKPVEKIPRGATKVKKSAKVQSELDDLIKELDKTLGSTLASGVNPQAAVIGAKIVGKYVELGVVKFAEIAQDVYAQYGEEAFRKYFLAIKGGYGSLLATSDDPELTPLADIRKLTVDNFITQPESNDTGTTGNLESDSQRPAAEEQVRAENVSNEQPADRGSVERGSERDAGTENQSESDLGFSNRIPPTSGERPDPGVDPRKESEPVAERVGRGTDDNGSTSTDDVGVQPKPNTTERPSRNTGVQITKRLSHEDKVKLQERANRNVAIIPKDYNNILESMPILLPHQAENVLKAETRFLTPPTGNGTFDVNKGILFTDATGTGKTYTGLGIIKRMQRQGVNDVLIVVPTDAKVKDWQDEAQSFGLQFHQLRDTKDGGEIGKMIVTTYANFRQNPALLARANKKPFGLVMYDESHKIVSNESGDATAADGIHKEITNAPNQAWSKAKLKYESQYTDAYSFDTGSREKQENVNKLIDAEAKKLTEATKVVFLSASPFAYHKNLLYADGYLFNIMQGEKEPGKAYKQFFVSNFGYRIRYSKLTAPEADVDVGLMERAFHTNLTKRGAISSTRLQLDKDYSREFVLVDDKIGLVIDEGYKAASDHDKYKYLPDVISKKFSFLYENQLLEAIKAKRSIERIQQHLDLGRKVVLFHSYNNSIPSHPFDLSDPALYPKEVDYKEVQSEISAFHAEHPQYRKLDLRDLKNPIATMLQEFGDKVVLFNGTVPKADRKTNIKIFNKDGSGKDIIVVQMEAGKEGISLHDVSGKQQRVMMNLGLPVRPTDAIQTEGRIYRIGQMSDAIVEYPVLHLNFEKSAFASKINERVSTAENLAFGEQSRNLKEAFKEGYKAPILEAPNDQQGTGGRDADFKYESIDAYDFAKTLYFSRQKRNAKTKAREGTDYFATPEPLGLKIAEWLHPEANQSMLEPSAGHGAIARFFPENTKNKFIEPSIDLRSDLSINATGEVLSSSFENHHIINKYDRIGMNPPFGTAGKTAWDHTEKAMGHLRDGGRVVVILPDGPSMQKYIDKWLEDPKKSEDFFITAKISLPTVTFERAGTSVKTQILVIDHQTNPAVKKLMPQQRSIDLSYIEDIGGLFDELKELQISAPLKTLSKFEGEVVERTRQDAPKIAGDVTQVVPGVHTKHGYKIWTVRYLGRVERALWDKANAKCKALGGFYSGYTGGKAIAGFIFRDNSTKAEQLSTWINQGMPDGPEDSGGRGSTYNMMSNKARGTTPASNFEARPAPANTTAAPFKMHQEVIELSEKYNDATLGQGYQGRGNTGSFYRDSGNIRLTGLSDLSVAMHELTHAIDRKNNVIKDFIKSTTATDPIRKRLTDLYTKHYPNGRPSHDLNTRMVEGYATLVQKYIESPTSIKADFPDLIDAFLKPSGQYWKEDTGNFIQDVSTVIAKYQMLDPLAKMGTRITNDVIDQPNKTFLTTSDKITQQTFDQLYPIEKLAKMNKTHFTQDDLSLWIRMSNNALQLAEKNISSKKQKFWQMDKTGKWAVKHNFNYYTLTKSLDQRGLQEEFAAYLYARRLKFEYDEVHDLENKIQEVNSPQNLADVMLNMGVSQQAATAIIAAQTADLTEELNRLTDILESEGVSEDEAKDAWSAGKQMFTEDEGMYDALVAEDLDFAHNPLVQLLDNEGIKKFKARVGYATFKRAMYDELVGGGEGAPVIKTVGKTKVSQFLTRRGSTKPVLNPLMGAMINHSELLRKGMRQMVYNKFLDVVKANPDLFQVLQLQVNQDASNRYPQDKDPNIIMAREGYKRVPILTDAQIKAVLDENYDYHNAHLLERVGVSMSQLFRTGTTGIFWQFFINNTFLDQIGASVNTRNGMFPFISSIRQMGPAALNAMSRGALFPNSPEAAYLKEYLFLAGTSQTFLSADIQGIKELRTMIKGEHKSWRHRVNGYFETVMKWLSTPGNATEIMTRGTEYILARKAGKPQVVALEEAGRVSAPFHHIGKLGGGVGRSYIRTVPYFNASLQVLKQTKDTLSTKQGRVRYAFAALSMVATAVSSTLYMMDPDDPDDERLQLLKSLPPDAMTKYLYFPSPFSKKRLLQIRVPENISWLAGLSNMMMLEGAGKTKYDWSEYGEASVSFAPTQMNPFNPSQMLFSYLPQAIKPAVELATGVKIYPNVRPIETSRDLSNIPELRYNKYTSPGAVALGEIAGWSPKKIDAFLEGTFGRSVKYITGKPGAWGFSDMFNKEIYVEASRQVQYFYQVKQRVSQQIKAYTDERKKYSPEEVRKMYAEDDLVVSIEGLLESYRDVEEDESQALIAASLRNQIFEKIKELEAVSY